MAMGKRRRSRQEAMWVETGSLPAAPGHPFYEALNELLAKHGFDDFVEELCAPHYAAGTGRPSLPPGVYFRCLMIGYFEGLDSERGIDWRVADSLTLRHFLGYDLTEPTPDHSTLSKTRRRLSAELHQEVFTWILALLAKEGLLKGRTVGVDATNLEANAALRSIVRRDTGEGYQEYLARLAEASGVETPTRQDRAQMDKKRPKKGSNDDWKHPHDPEARITKMADGRTRLAHKLEHTVDLDTQAIVSVQVSGADVGDPDTLGWSLVQADWNLTAASKDARARRHLARAWLTEVVTDKGYHSNATLKTLTAAGIRTHLSEPDRGTASMAGRFASASGGPCQPPSDPQRPGPDAAEAARRVQRTQLCAHAGHGPDATGPPSRSSQHLQTAVYPRRRLQPGSGDAPARGRGHPTGPARPSLGSPATASDPFGAAPRPRRHPIGRTNRHPAALPGAGNRALPTPRTASVSSSTAC